MEIVQIDEISDAIESDLPLEKLLELSKMLETNIENNLSTFKNERMFMINEMSKVNNYTTTLNEESRGTTNSYSEKQSTIKSEADSNSFDWKKSCEEPNLINTQQRFTVESNKNKFKSQQEVKEYGVPNMSTQNEIALLRDQSFNLKKILDIENKCHHWMDKYDELLDKFLRLESKCVRIEKENCSHQIEMARIKNIENENLSLNQAIEKSNRVRRELELALESCHKTIENNSTDVEVARNKVLEAVEMVEKTTFEKERLATDLHKSKSEIVRLEEELKDLIQEAGKRVNIEVTKVKNVYKEKLREANVEIEFLRTEKQIACNKTQQISKENEILNEKCAMVNQKLANESDAYAKKVALLIQQNKQYETVIDNLTAQIENLEKKNFDLQESYERKKTKFIQETMFLNDIKKNLENNLKRAMNKIAKINENIAEAKDKINSLETENSKLKQPESYDELEQAAMKELTKKIEVVRQMWKKEMYDIIEGFNCKINELKKRCGKMRKTNVKLRRIISKSTQIHRRVAANRKSLLWKNRK